jgi:Phage derived protein Gp49-like (DUF891)
VVSCQKYRYVALQYQKKTCNLTYRLKVYIKNLIPSEIKTNWRIFAICQSTTECQVDDFLSSLQANLAKHSKSMRHMLTTAALHGPTHFHKDVCHSIADDIWQFSKGDIRIAWFYDDWKVVICCQAAKKHL